QARVRQLQTLVHLRYSQREIFSLFSTKLGTGSGRGDRHACRFSSGGAGFPCYWTYGDRSGRSLVHHEFTCSTSTFVVGLNRPGFGQKSRMKKVTSTVIRTVGNEMKGVAVTATHRSSAW